MTKTIKVISRIDGRALAGRLLQDEGLWTFAAGEWHRLISPFTPMDSAALMDQVEIRPKQIHYAMPYARYIYEGDGLHFKTDHHPLACAHWDEAARPSQEGKLIAAMQAYCDGDGSGSGVTDGKAGKAGSDVG